MDVKGLAAVITGGASGLGAATARLLASKGAKVALLDMNLDVGRQTAAELGGVAIQCNVADAKSAEAAFAEAAKANGPARILINCAGIGRAARTVGKDGPMPLEQFVQVIN